MTKTFFTLFLAIATLPSMAQIPVLTSTTNLAVGDAYYVYYTDSFSPGPAGPAVTWHFDTLTTTQKDTIYMSACSASPHCAAFPGTSVYSHTSNNSNYLKVTSTAMTYLGTYFSSPMYYSNGEDELRYPFSYDSTFVDTFSSTFTNSGYTYHRWGTTTVTADAYGTLVLPNGTFSNVLRIKTYDTLSDSTQVGPTIYIYPYHNLTYTWYEPNLRIELASQTVQYNGAGYTGSAFYYTDPYSLAVPSLTIAGNGISIYPNPASDQININCAEGFEPGSLLEVFDLNGRRLIASALSGTNVIVSTLHLVTGLYECRVYRPGHETTINKLVVGK